MSKKSHPTHQSTPTSQPPWLWLVAGIAVLLAVIGLALSWNSPNPASSPQTSDNPTALPQQPNVPQANSTPLQQTVNGPRLAVDRTTIDDGNVKFNTPLQAVFILNNTGNQPLQILGEPQVELIEGC